MQRIKPSKHVLIIDSDVSPVLLQACAAQGVRTVVASSGKDAFKKLGNNEFDLAIVTNSPATGFDLETCKELKSSAKEENPELPVIMLSEEDSSRAGISAIREDFADFFTKPLSKDQACKLVETWLPNHNTHVMAALGNVGRSLMVGKSQALSKTIHMARRVAGTNAPVLICGESGTGKELLAQYIHDQSQRNNGPFVKVNCASLSESLLESELFGHEKGSFTGAQSTRKGRFERANGGTLLLDEITETPPAFQAQLLRVLEEQRLERVGSENDINVNVRVISTTNRDIAEEVRRGNFRADLYYRLSGVRIVVPALRERKEDLEELIWHFINELASETGRKIGKLDAVLVDVFQRYGWPGNVRQLRNVIRTCLILGTGETLQLADVSWLFEELNTDHEAQINGLADMIGTKSLAEIEQQAILATLDQTQGNRTKAAEVLGISDRTIREKIKRYRNRDLLQETA
ncbi:Transcriptional regulatory protein ZraR [Anaerohalosphaera lusitana]|uniref:Transcriptional regulatory protein ZraR n=1 Tax=Anaerohalosphaera lusitana TaxID=1936003 RepID=A0A1U9NG70_9BACT|nr:sigma-54 dependent transcriptional regulator [Anaerohalosphaera lusitana]AQT66929.1 Transcriptional regulatory protein ZraR [Anaerohalosphaera lusitana]